MPEPFAPPASGAPPVPRSSSAPHRARIEVQFHPADLRGRVRHLFLGDWQLRALRAGGLAWGVLVVISALLLPGVVRGYVGDREYEALVEQRQREGDRLEAAVARLLALQGELDGQRQRLAKVQLAYGLPLEPVGAGYPAAPQPVPESIYAGVVRRANGLESAAGRTLATLDALLRDAQTFEAANPELVATTPSLCPLAGDDFVLTSGFGNRRSPFTKTIDFHPGLDFAAPVGAPVRATAEGTVAWVGQYPEKASVAWWRFGNLVAVRNGSRFVTLYGHLDTIAVKVGQRLGRGDAVGTVGNSGWSTNPHLHYEVRRRTPGGEMVPVDPRLFLLDRAFPGEEQALAARGAASGSYEPLPAALAR